MTKGTHRYDTGYKILKDKDKQITKNPFQVLKGKPEYDEKRMKT